MPVITVAKTELFRVLGEEFTDDEFSDLCFKFGIELDDIHAEDGSKDITGVPAHKIMYKIEIPANRYDLLCLEGLSRALRIFRGRETLPNYRVSQPAHKQRMVIKESVRAIRGVVVCAVLRQVTFTQAAYNSFIDLQEKLHENICRKRTLVSIGTHDLDTIQGPFSYEALPPQEIVFAPLNKTVAVNGAQLMIDLAADNHLKKYLHIIQHLPVYPVIFDAQRRVLSLPPIINGNHSKITLNTRNVLVEITATDLTKALTVLDTMVAMFAQYCATPFEVEPVEIVHEHSQQVQVYPTWGQWPTVTADAAKICKQVGIAQQPVADLIAMLRRMSLPARASPNSATELVVDVPPTRSDVIAACDVMEDVAIGYGFERLIACKTVPHTLTSGRQQPLNKLTDQLRHVLACASYDEVLTFGLVSRNENFTALNKPDDGSAAVIANPKTQDFQIARTSLLPGLLKTLQSNKGLPLPLRVFEISDVVLKDASVDVGAANKRMLCAVYSDTSSGFENIHGLLDTIMTALEVPWKHRDESKKSRVKTHGAHQGPALSYEVLPSEDTTYFPGKRGDVYLNDKKIGVFGILHPEVLMHFGLTAPCSALQIEIEHFVDY